ncbi:M1 family metallopeptidase [Maribacter sp. CXY002]|uniref:M1 family metallopeptidase n=1 Tax=Maribacter luteocoastalis TaxID=3407671 RepID=UPI003B681038
MKKLFLTLILCASSFLFGQHQDKVDFVYADVFLKPEPLKKQIIGTVVYQFNVKQKVDSIFLDAKNMNFTKVDLDGKKVDYISSQKTITIYKKFKKGNSHKLIIEFMAQPEQTVYFFGWNDEIAGNEQIWTQGQGKYTSHWLPSFDAMEEKVEFDLEIVAKNKFTVIANGKLVDFSNKTEDDTSWRFNMNKPMSSYLLAFAIGNYEKQELTSSSGVPIENYYYPEDSLNVEPTYRYTKKIFDFLEKEIGVSYPWQNYKQIPVHDFLYAGMENTTATIFSDGYLIDSTAFLDKNYVNVNAHEMAHQWFGNLVTEKDGNHHWLHEGFATYFAYLAEKEIFGDDYFYWNLYRKLQILKHESDQGNGQRLLDPKASSLTFYEKGALALYMLRNDIGDTTFTKGVANYLKKYQFKNVTVEDFLTEIQFSSESDLTDFKDIWLASTELPYSAVLEKLQAENVSLAEWILIQGKVNSGIHGNDLSSIFDETNSKFLKTEIVKKYHKHFNEEQLQSIFDSNIIEVRQQLALQFDSIPLSQKQNFESLLDDDSYVTIENALFKLWMGFPDSRLDYLEKTSDIIGLPNRNVRLLWLALALVTPEYKIHKKSSYLKELTDYTFSSYNWEIRQNAFQYLSEIKAFQDESLLSLIIATNHYSWQFRNFSRRLLDQLLEEDALKSKILGLVNQLKSSDLRYLKTKIELP